MKSIFLYFPWNWCSDLSDEASNSVRLLVLEDQSIQHVADVLCRGCSSRKADLLCCFGNVGSAFSNLIKTLLCVSSVLVRYSIGDCKDCHWSWDCNRGRINQNSTAVSSD